MVILYIPSEEGYAHQKLFNSKSAVERSTDWAKSLNTTQIEFIAEKDITVNGNTSLILFLEKLSDILSKNSADYAIFSWADCPFLNTDITKKLIEYHEDYKAEYTFAEGFPYGLSPELIHSGTVSILLNLAKAKGFENASLQRDSLFSVIKTDINSFEIETYISNHDWRYLRLHLACSNKRNTLACERLFDIAEEEINDAIALSSIAEKASSVQRTLPAFYAIQAYSSTKLQTVYEPSLGDDEMSIENFKKVIKKIEAFSEDAVVSLSFFSDPVYHKDFLTFVSAVLECPKISLLIETDGTQISNEMITAVKALVGDNPVRPNGQRTLNWIIRLDATDSKMYNHVHLSEGSNSSFDEVLKTIEQLKEFFPHAVYPQMVRMNCNEDQLESFFRKWTQDGTGDLIVQKFDPLSGLLDDVRPADLSPAKRYPCWHIKRDMNILFDGTVVRCKAAAFALETEGSVLGNAFEEDLSTIWARGEIRLAQQIDEKYIGQCEKSDEYYTFNF